MLRLAELLASVSLATDLAHDRALESALGDALLSLALAERAGLPSEDLSDVYYLALLYHLGCTAAADAQTEVGAGDDISVRRWLSEADFADKPAMMRIALTRISADWGPVDRARAAFALMRAGPDFIVGAFASICEVAARLSERLGASERVTAALDHAYARWDGRVFFALPNGDSISLLARLVHLVHVAHVYHQAGGLEAADAVVRDRSGTEFDPELSQTWLEHSQEIVGALAGGSLWERALAAEPAPVRRVSHSHIDRVTAAFADFADLKSAYTRGHSAQVADLASGAGTELGLDAAELIRLRRSAQVHDLGNVSVPNRVWLNAGGLNRSEWARVRLHAYHSQQVLGVAEPLRDLGELAGLHHERLDGSGYHRGLPAAAIPRPARLLAAVEVYQSMLEERPWREAMPPEKAGRQLRQEVADGKLDRDSVDAVLGAAGHPRRKGRAGSGWPAGLTDREVEVLRMLARGRSNREIAESLHLSEATVHTHLINVYGKAAVKTRAGATLFALENDLIQF
jgi:HD-GYP domain-containing protein (c-di-GMP phosphodiesterase class II)/DNA-binding CsgD family transcriptional regulator